MGSLLLFAAVIAWGTSLMMSPHGEVGRRGHPARAHQRRHFPAQQRDRHPDPLRRWPGGCFFPQRRPRWPARDWAIIAVLAVLVLTSLYQLFWLRSVVQ